MQEGPRKSPSFMIQSYKASSQGLTQTTIWPGWLLQVTQNKCPHGLLLNSGEEQQRLLPPAALCLNLSWPQPEIRSDVRAYWAQPCSETQLSSGSSQILHFLPDLFLDSSQPNSLPHKACEVSSGERLLGIKPQPSLPPSACSTLHSVFLFSR